MIAGQIGGITVLARDVSGVRKRGAFHRLFEYSGGIYIPAGLALCGRHPALVRMLGYDSKEEC